MVTLRPMTESEYQHMQDYMFEDYARETADVRGITIEEGRAEANRQIAQLLPDGIATAGHHFWKVVAEDGTAVGDLWVLAPEGKERAFIYFIGIDDAQRGHGYGRAAMLALEAVMKPLGVAYVDLNVFGDNTVARNLYESLGYQPTAINMRKMI